MFQKNWPMFSFLWLLRGVEAVSWASIPAGMVAAVNAGSVGGYVAMAALVAVAGLITAGRLSFDTRAYAVLVLDRASHLTATSPEHARARLQRFQQQVAFLESGVPAVIQGIVDLAVGMVFVAMHCPVGAALLVAAAAPCLFVSRIAMAATQRIGEKKNELVVQEADVYAVNTKARFAAYYQAKANLEVSESDVDAVAFGINTTLARWAALGAAVLAVTTCGAGPAVAVTVYFYGDRVSNSIDRFTVAAQRWAAAKVAAEA